MLSYKKSIIQKALEHVCMALEHVCMFENPLPVMDFEHTYMDFEHTYKHIASICALAKTLS